MSARTFTCALCHETYLKIWSDEEAAEEAEHLFTPAERAGQQATVCDDCFREMAKQFGWPT